MHRVLTNSSLDMCHDDNGTNRWPAIKQSQINPIYSEFNIFGDYNIINGVL